MDFRQYSPSDLEAMVQLDNLCFSLPFRFDRVTMQQFAEGPGAITVLVEDGVPAELVAFIILHLQGTAHGLYAYVVTIDVTPGHRRAGIGAAMLGRAESAARSAGATQIVLHVAAGNRAAIAFYEDQHYRRKGVAKHFYREADEDAIVYAKPL